MPRTPESFTKLHDWATQSVKLSRFNLTTEQGRQRYAKAFDKLRRGHVGAATNTVQRALRKILDAAVERSKHALLPRKIPNMVGRAVDEGTGPYVQAMENIYVRLYLAFAPQILSQFRDKALKQEPGGRGSDLSNSERARFTNMARAFVKKHGGTLIKAPTRTTKRRLMEAARKAVQEGLEKGWGTDRIAEQIREYAQPAVSKVRSRRIARTETLRASNAGTFDAAQSLNTQLWKEWVALMDSRTRPTHVSADAQRVLKDRFFTVGGFQALYPNDTNLPAHESINCRCVVVFEMARQGATQLSINLERVLQSYDRRRIPDRKARPSRTRRKAGATSCGCGRTHHL